MYMGKLHELLAVEKSVTEGATKLMAETNAKFSKSSEMFSGGIRKLKRLNNSPEDEAIEKAAYRSKQLPTDVPTTLAYITPFVAKMLNVKMGKHFANQRAVADIMLNGEVFIESVPVDFLLDLEKFLPKWRDMLALMPTLDPSREWDSIRDGVWRCAEATETSQTEKIMYPVIMHEATKEHPAQVKESTRDVVVGLFEQTDFSGAATSQQKADALKLCDELLTAVKEARMRANTVEVTVCSDGEKLMEIFNEVFE
jgi:hypothetical protein